MALTLTIRLAVPPLESQVSRIRFLQNVIHATVPQIDGALSGQTEGDITGVDAAGNSHAILGEWELSS